MPVEMKPLAPAQTAERTADRLRRRIDCSGPASWARGAVEPAPPTRAAGDEASGPASTAA
jgi:hypothetical protein